MLFSQGFVHQKRQTSPTFAWLCPKPCSHLLWGSLLPKTPLQPSVFFSSSQKSREGSVREGGVAQICRKLRAKSAQNCRYFVSYIRGRVCKAVANLLRIQKSISDNFMQIPLFQCTPLEISDLLSCNDFRMRYLFPHLPRPPHVTAATLPTTTLVSKAEPTDEHNISEAKDGRLRHCSSSNGASPEGRLGQGRRSWVRSPCAPAEARRWSFWIFAQGNLAGIFRDFSDPQNKDSKISGKFRSIFRKKIRSSIKFFRAKFALQMCHLKNSRFSEISKIARKPIFPKIRS